MKYVFYVIENKQLVKKSYIFVCIQAKNVFEEEEILENDEEEESDCESKVESDDDDDFLDAVTEASSKKRKLESVSQHLTSHLIIFPPYVQSHLF